jgi:hypothetical protein
VKEAYSILSLILICFCYTVQEERVRVLETEKEIEWRRAQQLQLSLGMTSQFMQVPFPVTFEKSNVDTACPNHRHEKIIKTAPTPSPSVQAVSHLNGCHIDIS